MDVSSWDIPKNLCLADPRFNEPAAIDLLIGADCFLELLAIGQIKLGEYLPSLQKTLFGWIVAGKVKAFGAHPRSCHLVSKIPEGRLLSDLVQKFWCMEEKEYGYSKYTEEEVRCEQSFLDNIHRSNDGHLVVKYPFKCDPRVLGSSLEVAKKRFYSVERKLMNNLELKTQYLNFMKEYEDLEHMELVSEDELPAIRYYAPHHAVLRPDSTTPKGRVVFDCSCRTSSNISLNEILMKGPTIQDDLLAIISRFRMVRYALTGDISKMYRQILVRPEDTKFQCILWIKDPTEDLKTYRLKTVTYGTTSAPFLATRCLQYLAEENKVIYPNSSAIIKSDFYMDDLITGADDVAQINEIRREVTEILSSVHFNLTKWYSNDKCILSEIPEKDREKPLRINDPDVIKTLGIIWRPETDEFCYIEPELFNAKRLTKRIVLSQTAQLFDPLGLVNPIIVRAKMFLQELWKLKLKWDDSFPQSYHTLWVDYIDELRQLNSIKVPRYVLSREDIAQIEIHGFADASAKAYGCCIYTKTTDVNGYMTTNLIAAKSRVAPVKTRTLPQLELCAAELLVELWLKVKVNFKKPINKTFLWTDSEIVLSWLSSLPSTWTTYVANRVGRIQQNVQDYAEWRHVSTKENPADIVSRGSSVADLNLSIWFTRPNFLKESSECWPKHHKKNPNYCEVERKQVKVTLVSECGSEFANIYARTNDFEKIRCRFGYVFRFYNNLKARIGKPGHTRSEASDSSQIAVTPLTTSELELAFSRIVWNIQQKMFRDEIGSLEKKKEVHKESRINNLNPFLEEQAGVKILRVGGRLQNTDLPYDTKCPILLPQNHPVVKNYIKHLHIHNFHAGPQALVAFIRQRFWVVNARKLASAVFHNCVHCFKYRPKLQQQLMGSLPKSRITAARAFVRCGVEFWGPMYTTLKIRGKSPIKTYVAVFVCFTTKAVHMEIVSDLSTRAFQL